MSELNQLYGEAKTLPGNEPLYLSDFNERVSETEPKTKVAAMRLWLSSYATACTLNNTMANTIEFSTNASVLRNLTLYDTALGNFPNIQHLRQLEAFSMTAHYVRDMPDLNMLTKLKRLVVANGGLYSVSPLNLPLLEVLEVSENMLSRLPVLDKVPALKTLSAGINQISVLPDLSLVPLLESLTVPDNQLPELPSLAKLTKLKALDVSHNLLSQLPSLDGLTLITNLNANENKLTELPSLSAQKELNYLSVENNQLTSLPSLTGLTKLRTINASNNKLTAVAIDNILLQVEAANSGSNGSISYRNNTGAPEAQRSTDAAAAKTRLLSRGWTISF